MIFRFDEVIFKNIFLFCCRNIVIEPSASSTHPAIDNWPQESFGAESNDSIKAKKNSFDSGVSFILK